MNYVHEYDFDCCDLSKLRVIYLYNKEFKKSY